MAKVRKSHLSLEGFERWLNDGLAIIEEAKDCYRCEYLGENLEVKRVNIYVDQ